MSWAGGCTGGCTEIGPSDRKGSLHRGGLQLPLGAFPVAVDIGCHLQRGVAEVPGEPRDLGATLQSSLGERVAEAVERALLERRSHPWDAGARHGRVEVAAEHGGRIEKRGALRVGEHEALATRTPPLAPTPSEQLDNVRDQVDVTTLSVLRCPDSAACATAPNAHDRLLEIDIAPAKCEQLPLPHARLEREQHSDR